ncbi:efflux RND transporter permease subunit [Alienimonas californiensis]|uniref:Multidrug resistance protein MdtB n=1 Tax=Alienimonas californiensis TaxID=2527989 RepID=A0A517P8Y0_9PLAN|nr:efflux RND transporter permease subunit [Alienimonas californiensis]QDT15812.1 Multidrug resistance protein MdtB [Alienimonas californiensis]
MNFIAALVSNPVKVAVGVLLTMMFGLVALARMPMQLTPEVQTPTITVETRWPGASPQEIEREIVVEQEEQLKSVENVTKLTSESTDSSARITMEFRVGTKMDRAVVDVIGRLEQVPQYPRDADKPVISTANSSDRPIAWFILGSRMPLPEELDALEADHPELAEGLAQVRKAHNEGLAMLRLRLLAEKHEAVRPLMPPPELNVSELKRFAEDEIEARLERVSGVSQANVRGGLEDELQVIVDPQKLAARRLTLPDVRRVLQGQNADVSAGDFWEGKRRYVVRTLGQFRSPQQVADQPLAVVDGAPVYVRDVAEVKLGFKKPDGLVRRFGESSIAVNAQRETGANVLDVMDGLRGVVAELNDGILKERGLQLTQVYDETDYIYSAVELVQQNIVIGGALTMIVLMLFLHLGVRALLVTPLIALTGLAAATFSPWYFVLTLAIIVGAGFWFARGALVVGLAIPTSIVGTFLLLDALGRSLNVVSLAGLAFAVGMLVDNAVVVLENIYRRYDELGEPPTTAAVRGTQEVWGAVLSSTLTTVAVFLPIVFIQEEAGQLFRDIALAISGAVALSLVVSMTLIPTASARLFGNRKRDQRRAAAAAHNSYGARISRGVAGPIERAGGGLTNLIVGVNAWLQRGFLRRVVAVVVLFGVSASCLFLVPQVEYLPTGNRNLVFGILMPPPGYNLDQLMEMGEQVEADLKPYWNTQPGTPEAAALDYPIIGDFFFVARGREVFMGLRADDPARVGELVPLVQEVGAKLPGTFTVAKQSSLFERGLTAGRTIDVEITGPELEELVAIGGRILGATKGLYPEAQVRPVPSLDLSSPEVHIEPKLLQAADMQVSAADLGFTADALIDGAFIGDYFVGGDKIDLTLVGIDRYAGSADDLRTLPVATPEGRLVPMEALANVRLTSGPEQVNHRERVRSITIEVSPPPSVALETAMERIRDEVIAPLREQNALGPGMRINLAGTADKLEQTWQALWVNLALALLITYLLMAGLFESWIYPLVIICTVVPGALGGVLGLRALNFVYAQPLDVLTMLGFFILIGTVVNNAILIVHQALNNMREEGMGPDAALLESVRTRIRPIFMTTMTTVLGLLPLVLFPGAGSELYRGLGSVVLGGLIVATLFTLVLVPTLFSLTRDLRAFFFRLLGGKSEQEDADVDEDVPPPREPTPRPRRVEERPVVVRPPLTAAAS